MGKIEDMQKQREARWAETQERRKAAAREARAAVGKGGIDEAMSDAGKSVLENEPSTSALPAAKKPATRAQVRGAATSGAKGRSVKGASTAGASSSCAEAEPDEALPRAPSKAKVFPNTPTRTSADADEGRCTGCGKLRAVRRGKIVHHMKGFGKPCPGVGKEPS